MLITDLRIFLAVAAAGSLSAAARQLDIAPMQVSRRVAALEQELGARLLHRTTRAVSLTAEGEALLPYANTITEAEDSAQAALGTCATQASGILRMTAPSVFGQSIVLPLLSRLLVQHPGLRVDLDLSDKVVDIVAQGLDLALRIAPLEDSELVGRKIAANPRILCAAPGYLRQHGTPRTLGELENHECILLQAIPRWPFVVDGGLQRRRMHGRFGTSSVEAMRAAAVQGLGLAMLTYWDVFQQLSDGSLVRIELEDASMEQLSVWAVTPTRRYLPTRVKLLLDALAAELVQQS